jgi:uncharacterized glyoxalase superfamily protein PhnB
MPESVIIPELTYRDVSEAVAWLCRVFGFKERLRIGDHRAQLSYNQGSIVVTQMSDDKSGSKDTSSPHTPEQSAPSLSVMVRVKDIDAHYERSMQSGAQIMHPPTDYPYGERQYTVRDLGGHVWTFSQTISDVDPAAWGGELLDHRNDGD